MFTSLQPSVHRILGSTRGLVLPESVTTLAEVLREHNYATGAFTENAAISAPRGFFRGFDTYREVKVVGERLGHVKRTLGDGLKWLERNRGRQFFLFLHTYQVHTPYQPPPAYAELFEGDGHVFDPRLDGRPKWHPNHYDGEIRYTDDSLADFFGRARAAGLLKNTIVVFLSDHGEAFLEHDLYAHGPDVHEEVVRVPLIFFGPGIPRGQRVSTPVGLIDLMPTLLELAHASAPPGLMGRSFASLLRGDGDASEFANRPIISEAWWQLAITATGGKRLEVPIFAVRRGNRKLLRWPQGSDFRFAYYDLASDPGERRDLYDPDDPDAASLRELLHGYPDQMAALRQALLSGELPSEVQPDPERQEKLRALGYLE
jgi:arylsulfatase A-like enzyme